AADYENVPRALALQRFNQGRDQGLVACGVSRYADDVDVVFDRLPGGFLGGLDQRADIDVETDIGEGGGDDLGAAVVAVLAQFGDEHARPPPLLAGKTLDFALDAAERLVVLVLPAVNPAHGTDLSAMAGKHLFERVGDLADRRPRAGRLDRQRQEVAFAALRRLGQRGERGIHPALVAHAADPREPLD